MVATHLVAILDARWATPAATLAKQLVDIEPSLLSHRAKLFLDGRSVLVTLVGNSLLQALVKFHQLCIRHLVDTIVGHRAILPVDGHS